MTVRVFAYGSNMCLERVRARVSSARPLGAGMLAGHSLRFHKRGRDGSAKADAFHTERASDIVWGVVLEIDRAAKPQLDRFESLGVGYDQKPVEIVTADGGSVAAFTYTARAEAVDVSLTPFDWYVQFVLAGARQHRLPAGYIEGLQRLESVVDPIRPRRRRNLEIIASPA